MIIMNSLYLIVSHFILLLFTRTNQFNRSTVGAGVANFNQSGEVAFELAEILANSGPSGAFDAEGDFILYFSQSYFRLNISTDSSKVRHN